APSAHCAAKSLIHTARSVHTPHIHIRCAETGAGSNTRSRSPPAAPATKSRSPRRSAAAKNPASAARYSGTAFVVRDYLQTSSAAARRRAAPNAPEAIHQALQHPEWFLAGHLSPAPTAKQAPTSSRAEAATIQANPDFARKSPVR